MIQLSSTAVNEILRLKAKRKTPNLLFRLGVQSSGCLGLSYAMGFEPEVRSGDRVFDCNGIQIIIDSHSLPYLNNLAIDYSEDLMGGGFRFRNPNADQSCSCGNSFSISG